MSLGYIGSKKSLLSFLDQHISPYLTEQTIFGDLFAGTGIVGKHFQGRCFQIVSNDVELYAYVINRALLMVGYSERLQNIITEYNLLEPQKGLFSRYYSEERMFFTSQNANRIDGIRQTLQLQKETERITEDEYFFLLASLLVSADRVANTTSVYGAYLKHFKASAQKDFVFIPIHTSMDFPKGKVYHRDILSLAPEVKCDVVYLDPPYTSRQYGANYSPLNFLVRYDEETEVRGKGGLLDYFKSPFCQKAKVLEAFQTLLDSLVVPIIFISYSSESILPIDELVNLCQTHGVVTIHTQEYKKYKSGVSGDTAVVLEYLIEIHSLSEKNI